MKSIRSMAIGAAAALVVGAIGVPVMAETPANMLIIAGQLDDAGDLA